MSTSAVSNTDLFLSKPYHQPVNSWVKTNLDVSPFTLTNVRGIHHLALFEKTSRLWAKQKKLKTPFSLNHQSIQSEWQQQLVQLLSESGFFPANLRMLPENDLDWLTELWSLSQTVIIQMCMDESWDKIREPQVQSGSSISLSQRPRVNKSLWVKLLLLVKTWNSKNPGRINSEPLGSSTCESTSGGVPSCFIRLHQSRQPITLTACACTVHVCWSLPANIPVKWDTAV